MVRAEGGGSKGTLRIESAILSTAQIPDSIAGSSIKEVFSDAETTALWFAGITEPGTSVTIGVTQYWDRQSQVTRLKTLPALSVHTTSPQMLDRLYDTYGGERKSRLWRKSGAVAAEIVAATLPYAVARRDHAAAMQLWLQATSVEEQIEIAREIQYTEWQQKANPEDYKELLENPPFVAGVLDSRAYIDTRRSKNFHNLYIQTTSKNVALLHALQEKFGGRVRITDEASTKVDHGTVVFETKVDSYVWEILGSQAIHAVRFCQQFLQSELPAGWDYQRAVEEQQEIAELRDTVIGYIRWEMAEYLLGNLDAISTRQQLKERFGIGGSFMERFLNELTKEERKKRHSIVKSVGQLTQSRVRSITDEIEAEVRAYVAGQIDHLPYVLELDGPRKRNVAVSVIAEG